MAQLRLEVPEPSRAVAVRLQCSRGSKEQPSTAAAPHQAPSISRCGKGWRGECGRRMGVRSWKPTQLWHGTGLALARHGGNGILPELLQSAPRQACSAGTLSGLQHCRQDSKHTNQRRPAENDGRFRSGAQTRIGCRHTRFRRPFSWRIRAEDSRDGSAIGERTFCRT